MTKQALGRGIGRTFKERKRPVGFRFLKMAFTFDFRPQARKRHICLSDEQGKLNCLTQKTE